MIRLTQACKKYNLAPQTVHKKIAEGKIKFIRVGRNYLVEEDDVKKILPRRENLFSKVSFEKAVQVGENVRKLRTKFGMNQKEFAKAIGVNHKVITKLEKGITYTTLTREKIRGFINASK